jgi:hypothetical protein
MSHYKFLIELAIKCLHIGTKELSPSLFLKHNRIKCVVAILHSNNGKNVPISYLTRNKHSNSHPHKSNKKILPHSHRSEQREQCLLNNLIGFTLLYPHSNCRPYPDSVWMLGWQCIDYHRIRMNDSQNIVIEAMMRKSFQLINPHSDRLSAQYASETLKRYCRNYSDFCCRQQREEDNNTKQRDSIGIYAPLYHKNAQTVYEAIGYEKIA